MGARLRLPPSKKTRALLGYLVLTGKQHRRERLCELLWDVADDPRAALRWSLSKLRELVDREDTPRLLTDREQVRLDLSGAQVDVFEVRPLLRMELGQLPTEQLERALSLFRGELLEGLELPDFHAYHAFCRAEREALRGLQARILCELLERHVGRPEQALPLARKWVDLDPESETARARFQQLLHASGRAREAALESLSSHRLLDAALVPAAPRPPNTEAVEGASAASRKGEPSQPLVGRVPELARLRALTTLRSRAAVVLISGEAGVGKSRLIEQLLREQTSQLAFLHEAAAHEVEPGFPYAPVRSLLARLGVAFVGAPAQAVHGQTDERSPLAIADAAQAARERERLCESASRALLHKLASGERVLLVFEDVHWFDEASAQLLSHLLRACAEQPVVVLLSARRGELADNAAVVRLVRALRGEPGLEELTLGPLSREETTALVRQVAHEADQRSLERVYEQSAGNALLALELARAGDTGSEQLPPSIAQLVRERMEAVPGELRELLRWAAVLGSVARLEALEALVALAPERTVEALEQLERLGWLACDDHRGEGFVRFSHALVHRAVYDGLSSPRRRLMHARVAQQLSAEASLDGAHAAELARHALLGGDASTAVRACLAAGRRCMQLGAARDAAALARRALADVGRLPELESCRLELELLELCLLAQRPRAGDPDLDRLHTLAARALALGQLEHARRGFFVQAFLRWEAGQVVDAQRFSREAERCSRLAGPKERLCALADATRCLVLLERDLTEAQAFVLEAEALIAAGEPEVAGVALARGMLAQHGGALSEAAAALERARSLAAAEGDHLTEFFALAAHIDVVLERAEWDEARALSVALLASAQRCDGSEEPFALAQHSLLQHAQGHATAEQLALALERLSLADAKQRSASLLARWSELLLAEGELLRARSRASEGLSLARAVERTTEVAVCQAVLAQVAHALGEQPEAARLRAELTTLREPLSARARSAITRALETTTDGGEPPSKRSKQDGARHRRARLPRAG